MFLLLALFGVHFADELHSSFYEWENKKIVEKINDLKKYQMFDDDGKLLINLSVHIRAPRTASRNNFRSSYLPCQDKK